MEQKATIRLIASVFILALTLVVSSQSNWAMANGQTCFSSTAVHQFCIFYEYTGFSSPRDITMSPDSSMFAVTSPENNTQVFSALEGRVIQEIPESMAYSLAFSPDSRMLAIGSEDAISLWDARTRVVTKMLSGFEGEVFSLAFSPDGRYLVSGGEGTIHLWSMLDGELLDSTRDNNLHFLDAIGELIFSPDSTSFVSMSIEGGKLWSIDDNLRLNLHREFNTLADTGDFSSDGGMLAISGVGMNIEIYNTSDYVLSKVIPFRSRPESNRGTSSLRFTHDDKALIVGELGVEDFTAGLQIIDIETSETILKIGGSGNEVYEIEPAFGGEFAVGLTSGQSDYIIYWQLQ